MMVTLTRVCKREANVNKYFPRQEELRKSEKLRDKERNFKVCRTSKRGEII